MLFRHKSQNKTAPDCQRPPENVEITFPFRTLECTSNVIFSPYPIADKPLKYSKRTRRAPQ